MSPKITVLRIMVRGFLALMLIGTAVLALFWLKSGLDQPETNAALIGLLGAVLAYVGAALKDLISAIAANPSDQAGPE